ncbi:MAG: hypothetical protein ONB48_10265 [candidate division KSB1 bacterium]|nr:hypothetical protein [candidate division KSB1 bacterium]MDZ7273872.1 hypothetical protein [candidate division KSB1 bacterium]MDZ7286028.1 hypothetical protein [candidate division KSB1 bacterium]MDZ7299060.1 hypothetical protein [candidate division KSB1 bacterium]MDZ7308197.1 hypothetical protein [candidate division KSB1 bacterium]
MKTSLAIVRCLSLPGLLLFAAMACQNQIKEENRDQGRIPVRDINQVMQDHTAEWMALPGVVGVYIGAQENGRLCIRVMVVEKTEALEQKIPRSVEGHPVEIEETGEIRPM